MYKKQIKCDLLSSVLVGAKHLFGVAIIVIIIIIPPPPPSSFTSNQHTKTILPKKGRYIICHHLSIINFIFAPAPLYYSPFFLLQLWRVFSLKKLWHGTQRFSTVIHYFFPPKKISLHPTWLTLSYLIILSSSSQSYFRTLAYTHINQTKWKIWLIDLFANGLISIVVISIIIIQSIFLLEAAYTNFALLTNTIIIMIAVT